MIIETLPLSAQTLYSDLLQMVVSAQARRSLGDLPGTFVAKTIKDKTYWYLQYSVLGKKHQIYLGPESPQIKSLIANFHSEKKDADIEKKLRSQLCRMILQGGGSVVDAVSSKVLELFADSGLFHAGGVLVGSHAFACYANMLGVKWSAGIRTHDIDLAYDQFLAVIFGENLKIDLSAVIENAKMGFHPVPALNPKSPSTSFKMRGKELHVDILTPLLKSRNTGPIQLSSLGVAAEPLRYLDYLIEDTEKTIILYGDGILVNVPQPSRYAWHKLIVMQERSSYWKAKIQKDILQCAQLMQVLLEQRPAELADAWQRLGQKKPSWQRYAQKGFERLIQTNAELARIKDVL